MKLPIFAISFGIGASALAQTGTPVTPPVPGSSQPAENRPANAGLTPTNPTFDRSRVPINSSPTPAATPPPVVSPTPLPVPVR